MTPVLISTSKNLEKTIPTPLICPATYVNETINALAMASPFSIEEKQVLLEAKNLDIRKTKIAEILTTYSFDQYNNTTIQ